MRYWIVALGFLVGMAQAAPVRQVVTVAQGRRPRMAADTQGYLHAVYQGREDQRNVADILYTRSHDAGLTWTAPQNISQTPGVSSDADISVEQGGAIDVVWCDTSSGGEKPDVYFARSVDGGTTWSPAVDVSNTPGASSQPALATDATDAIHVVWVDTNHGVPDIFFATSPDGQHWSRPTNLSHTPGVSLSPAIALGQDASIHIVWAESPAAGKGAGIFYTSKVDAGWTTPLDVSHTSGLSILPVVGCGPDGDVYIVWTDNQRGSGPDIFFSVARGGEGFTRPRNLSLAPGRSSQPGLVSDNLGRLAIAWLDTRRGMGQTEVRSCVSLDRGRSFSQPSSLARGLGKCDHLDLAMAGATMAALWEESGKAPTLIRVSSKPVPKSNRPTAPTQLLRTR